MASREYYVPKAAQKKYLDGGISSEWTGSLHQSLIENSTK
jgi:hypothetical protein